MSEDRRIVELMRVPAEQRDVGWLRQSLQVAVELELATLPPYLCGLWSITEQEGPVFDLIRRIAMEEMLHMGLACNLLTTIGGTPQIATATPVYPGPLPGGVRPELTVYLAGLTREYVLHVYMQIERPDEGPMTLALGELYPTLGAFYDAILAAFGRSPSSIAGTNQLSRPVGGKRLFAIESLADVEQAIGEIKDQGEGTSQSPLTVAADAELPHYYRFAEIWHGKKLVRGDGTWDYTGDAVPFPNVRSMAPIPAGGYVNPSPEAAQALREFDEQYKKVLDHLQTAWAEGNPGELRQAGIAMTGLPSRALNLMSLPLPAGGVYGPDFVV